MPSKNRKNATEGETREDLSFEQAIAELELIVEQVENEQLPLNELIDQYEKGVRLYSICDKLLGQARERLEMITLKAGNPNHPTPAQPDHSESVSEGESDDNDIRLF